ncbi:phage holin family protein [Erwinia psidii]|uniref:Holin n=1 Tax=Erwinia psidii TaxID=69224 RepID=A0A3N6UTS6_9GAMM|nr:holin [Erwinia psidii]RQM39359.1 holin [Erwinia psidii]
MQSGETSSLFTKLILIGAVIGIGQVLVSNERITLRLALGRIILGSAVALVAGVLLLQFEDIPELAVIGVACALGIAGHTAIEAAVKSRLGKHKD